MCGPGGGLHSAWGRHADDGEVIAVLLQLSRKHGRVIFGVFYMKEAQMAVHL